MSVQCSLISALYFTPPCKSYCTRSDLNKLLWFDLDMDGSLVGLHHRDPHHEDHAEPLWQQTHVTINHFDNASIIK